MARVTPAVRAPASPWSSTDGITGARVASERSLLEYAAMFFKLGFSLDDVVRMTTQTPARVLGTADRAGNLGVGIPADASVLEPTEGKYKLTDTTGVSRVGDLALEPVVTLKAGAVCPASSVRTSRGSLRLGRPAKR